ncbi:hypothetical protein [Streptomyces sp. NPDC102360]|uniref:hypothetical protein n=1 Tax=Streptomyces sp. NPDC102360 TaxID=3366160 RepID=UPI00380E4903
MTGTVVDGTTNRSRRRRRRSASASWKPGDATPRGDVGPDAMIRVSAALRAVQDL